MNMGFGENNPLRPGHGICLNCKDRHIGCHGECEPYLKQKEEWKAYKDKIYEGKHKQALINRYEKERICRYKGEKIYER